MSLAKRLVINKGAIDGIAKSTNIKDVLMAIANDVAARASARADEAYSVTAVQGRKRLVVRVEGEEVDTSGYWRGVKTQALWSSPPRYGGNK